MPEVPHLASVPDMAVVFVFATALSALAALASALRGTRPEHPVLPERAPRPGQATSRPT